jgi:hypothetical protein
MPEYNNPQFLLYGITFLMLAPSPLQTTLLARDPLDSGNADDVKAAKKALADAGFKDPDYVWANYGEHLAHLTSNAGVRSLKDLPNVLGDVYTDDPPHPVGGEAQAIIGCLETLAST